jgi:hypothetical protein
MFTGALTDGFTGGSRGGFTDGFTDWFTDGSAGGFTGGRMTFGRTEQAVCTSIHTTQATPTSTDSCC